MKPTGSTTARQAAFWGLAAFGFALALVFVWLQTQQVRDGYRLTRIQSEYHKQLDLKRKLELDWAQLTAPGRLEKLAREHFELAPVTPGRILFVGKDDM
jgi:hypothetical protein